MSDLNRKEFLLDIVRRAARQEQFLEVISAEEAHQRFNSHLKLGPLDSEIVPLSMALTRVLAEDVIASVDVPPFDRSAVDGFAVRASDTIGASDTSPCHLVLNSEVIACGYKPTIEIGPRTATTISTGGVLARGADAVVMIEQTDLVEEGKYLAIKVRRAASPGQYISFAGSDIARGDVLLRKGTFISSREIGMLAACGRASVHVVRRPKVAVLSTGDELLPPGEPLRPASVYDSNGSIIAAAVIEAGGNPILMGIIPDDPAALEVAVRKAHADCDLVVLSGGTSKGAGDLSQQILSKLGVPGILVHGVALKPGKPLCLAVSNGKPIVALPGFPTSAIFTFHTFVAPVIRAFAGLPSEAVQTVSARVSVRIASDLGRREFALVALAGECDKMVALPIIKGSGAVTSFSQADGFIEIDPMSSVLEAGSVERVTLIGAGVRVPDLVIMGSHDIALDIVISALAEEGILSRVLAIGSQGGVAAARRRECDIAPVHLIDPKTGSYNTHLVSPGLRLVPGWQRQQGFIFRQDDRRFAGQTAVNAIQLAASDSSCLMINRNSGSGTRVVLDRLLEGRQPPGYSNQPKSHNAVATAIAQGRADWGMAIAPVAKLYGLEFLPVIPEQYDFLLVENREERPAVKAFLAMLGDERIRDRIRKTGMQFVQS